MSHLSPLSLPDRPDSRVSIAPSDTTYHSFHDVDLFEPKADPQPSGHTAASPVSGPSKSHGHPGVQEMRRKDSGYESMDRRDSDSSHRRASTASVTSSTRRQRRPCAHRSTRSGPVSYLPRNGRRSLSPYRAYNCRPSTSQQPAKFFHFPHFTTSEPALDETEMASSSRCTHGHSTASFPSQPEAPVYPLPPQTTHYWTSDRTRRLEYAAIDAASRGVRGWVMRHVVPDCFVPKSKRRLGFEDDRGSVVRYRLELEEDGAEKHSCGKRRRSWWWSQ